MYLHIHTYIVLAWSLYDPCMATSLKTHCNGVKIINNDQ